MLSICCCITFSVIPVVYLKVAYIIFYKKFSCDVHSSLFSQTYHNAFVPFTMLCIYEINIFTRNHYISLKSWPVYMHALYRHMFTISHVSYTTVCIPLYFRIISKRCFIQKTEGANRKGCQKWQSYICILP